MSLVRITFMLYYCSHRERVAAEWTTNLLQPQFSRVLMQRCMPSGSGNPSIAAQISF
jgi:hypothetical protein